MTQGYTLLELLIAIAVISMIAASVGTLQNGRGEERHLDADATAVRRFVIETQSEARRTGRLLTINPTKDRHGLESGTRSMGHLDAVLDAKPIAFDADGFSNGGSVVVSAGVQQRTIKVEALTGQVIDGDGP